MTGNGGDERRSCCGGGQRQAAEAGAGGGMEEGETKNIRVTNTPPRGAVDGRQMIQVFYTLLAFICSGQQRIWVVHESLLIGGMYTHLTLRCESY